MRFRALFAVAAAIATGFVMLVLSTGASAKAVGGCPPGFELVTVESLGITPEEASGIPSLDGNGDALTCIMPSSANEHAVIAGGFVFRDNTVMGGVS
jgi:hypothetical protein